MTALWETRQIAPGGNAPAHRRGHPIVHDEGRWVYADNGEPATTDTRPCTFCHRPPTPEGYDACLGHVPAAFSACCGHGLEPGLLCYDREDDYEDTLWVVLPRLGPGASG